MAIKINNVIITPNPVSVLSKFSIYVSVEDELLNYVRLFDNDNNALSDINNDDLYVINDTLDQNSYISAFSYVQISSFIMSVLGTYVRLLDSSGNQLIDADGNDLYVFNVDSPYISSHSGETINMFLHSVLTKEV